MMIAALYGTGAELMRRTAALSMLIEWKYQQMTRVYVETQHFGNMFQLIIIIMMTDCMVTVSAAMEPPNILYSRGTGITLGSQALG